MEKPVKCDDAAVESDGEVDAGEAIIRAALARIEAEITPWRETMEMDGAELLARARERGRLRRQFRASRPAGGGGRR